MPPEHDVLHIQLNVGDAKRKQSTSTYNEDVSSDESILDLCVELDAVEEEEVIRNFVLDPYEEDIVDLKCTCTSVNWSDILM